jgi:hypothetical protein
MSKTKSASKQKKTVKSQVSVLQRQFDKIIGIAEQVYGVRAGLYQIMAPVFHQGGPDIEFMPDVNKARVRVSNEARGDIVMTEYQLAHEAVHCLYPRAQSEVTCLEEGIAASFALWYIRLHHNSFRFTSGDANYDRVRDLVELHVAHKAGVSKHIKDLRILEQDCQACIR